MLADVLLDGWWNAVADRAALGDSLVLMSVALMSSMGPRTASDPAVRRGELALDLGR